MIVSNKFIRAQYGEPLRRHLVSVASIDRIVDLAGLPVFRGATVRTIVLVTRKERATAKAGTVVYSPPPTRRELLHVVAGTKSLAEIADPISYKIPARELSAKSWRLLRPEYLALMTRLSENAVPLHNFTDGRICMGVKSGLIEAFVITARQRREIIAENPDAKRIIRPFFQGRQIHRYS